jgi:hypothetical protein
MSVRSGLSPLKVPIDFFEQSTVKVDFTIDFSGVVVCYLADNPLDH